MGNRYSRIRQGAQLNQALTNYIAYLQTPRVPQVNSRGARNLNQQVYVTPFKVDLATDQVAAARVNPGHFTRLGARINSAGTGASVDTALGANSIVSLPKFRAARVVLQHAATRVVSVETSGITGNRYLGYQNVARFSCPFGRNLENDDEGDAFLAVKAAILAAETGQIRRVSWTREQIGVESA